MIMLTMLTILMITMMTHLLRLLFICEFKAVLAALNVEHGAAGEGLTEGEKKASLEVINFLLWK